MKNAIQIAQNIIEQEAQGLKILSSSLDNNFTKALNIISNTSGKIILSGMGKSGYIAKKIAATFSSTGTPAVFLHPAEASHGDLGIIGAQDVVILYSNSGETNELNSIINYCNRFEIPIIGITKKIGSTLMKSSSVTILLPQIPEASQLDAPSTSSTMMMALGDALALTLAEIRGFSHDDFRLLHPGGTIGARMITVKDLMHAGDDMPLIHANSSASEMIIEITRKRMGCVGVIDNNGELIGIVTDGDLRRHIDLDIKRSVASDFMHLNPVTVDQELLGVRALNLMNSKAITSIFIVEDHKPIGIVHMHDLLKFGIC